MDLSVSPYSVVVYRINGLHIPSDSNVEVTEELRSAAVTITMGPDNMSLQPRSLTIRFSDAEIADLKQRLANTRLPHSTLSPLLDGWDYGTNLDWLKAMVSRWQHDFDFRKLEENMNKLGVVPLDGFISSSD